IDKLADLSKRAIERVKKVPGAVDVDSTLVLGKPEVSVLIDREKAADLGVQVADIANALQLLVGGLKVSSYEERGEQYDVNVRAQARFRADVEG
ncbi:efflux RND transporter permease subunit, partial [Acinetobacter baumannii]|uniref:efflux RND transporter permease subunit n=1 Tax=Acinetobacter baumannii TaxID=470 RepID=UPI0037D3C09A